MTHGFRKSILFPITLMLAGIAAFFFFLFMTGHDPDEKPLTLIHWIIGGALIGPGFGYLIQWRRDRDRSKL
ncbi:hypothetical protein FS764_23490 [Agrobacterium vitis]|jgi:uncharacterized membrane-anchored protein YitT (DUF2179 family)|uniref:hypothetical protein n=1 Tax=Rhizobium/Agrobacterium group TaxID=227290 RepID=UPI0007136FB9|nr:MULTISPECIES: hypothetical protein [Rhizobium/Agrobacterium group]KQO79518.1 hypothetical protein ASF29_22800 [Rhizobium sp. Leaf262]MCF1469842.1 hypothetical protein [Agrobacterium vitis]NTF34073.1 hypothetical protein [Rhizobium skierniewicense]UHS64332.1 hypothetical protein HRR99_22185 [Agrobacterium vaccinii]